MKKVSRMKKVSGPDTFSPPFSPPPFLPRESGLFIDLPFSGCRGRLLLAHMPVQYRRHDGHEHEDEDGGEWTGLGEGCHRNNRRESEMACGAREGKAGAVAGFRAAEQMPDGQAPESEDRNGA
jgi:hypothetical protein